MAYGYLSSDATLSLGDSNEDFELNKAAYNIDFDAYQFQIGFFDNNANTNATDILFEKDNTTDFSMSFGSSKNLLENSERYYKKVDFYTPSAGSMTVYRNGRIIKQYSVTAGAGSISYSDLPSGRYDIRVEVISSGVVVLNQTYSIYNTGDNRLNPLESSFMFTTGVYHESSYVQYDDSDLYFEDEDEKEGSRHSKKIYANDFDDSLFFKGLYSYQLNSYLMLGTGATLAKDSNAVGKLGSQILLPFNSDVTFLYSQYNEGSDSKTVTLNTEWFNVNYEDYDHDENDIFAEYLQGKTSRKSVNVNTSYRITGQLSGQSSYNYGETNDDDYWSVNTSLNYQFSGGNLLNLNMMYAGYGEGTNSDGLEVTLNLTIPLSDNLSATSTLLTRKGDVKQFTNGLETDDLINDDDTNLQLKVAQSRFNEESVSELTATGSMSGKTYNSNVYAYADTSGERYLNGGFSSSQVVTNGEVFVTKEKADSYLMVDVDAEDKTIDNLGLLTLKQNERNMAPEFVYDDQLLIPLRDYESYQGELDTESVSLENNGDVNFNGFSFPGSTYNLNAKVGKVITFIATFEDLFANTVDEINCEGEACVDVIPVTDGVFKVAVREGQEFMLRSQGMVCLTPGVKNIQSLNLGQNSCVPYTEDENGGEFRLADENGVDRSIYYIGKFKDTAQIKKTYSYLNKTPYKIIEKKVEDDLLVYVSVDDGYKVSQNDRDRFNEILMTAGNDDSGIASPVVLVLDDSWR